MPIDLRATYRVQLQPEFGFNDAAAVVDYLAGLGISHLYCSPYLQAAPGSTHGYDVVNYHQVNVELGGAEAHARLIQALSKQGLGQILDLVPNHMAITSENLWWWDVLENGPASRYADYFDVEWDPSDSRRDNAILAPVLGDHYGRVIEAGEIQVEYNNGSFTICYYDNAFPVAPRSLDTLLTAAAERCGSEDLAFIADALSRLPPASATNRASVRRRHRDKEVLRRQLARLCEEQPETLAAINATVAELNGDPDALDAFLRLQNYRLAFWRMAQQDLGYRRFFSINTLVGLRVEDEQVFSDTHAFVLGWLAEQLDGFRIDHPDGLRDPEAYLQRLHQSRPDAWIVVEKILEHDEQLRRFWPVAGTTGYDFLNRVNGLFVDPDGETAMTRLYAEFTGESIDYPALVYEKKQQMMREELGSDVNRLTALFQEVCEQHRRHRDYIRSAVRDALCEVAAHLPVYRTYVRAEAGQVSADDVRYITEAVEAARTNRTDLDEQLFEFLRDLLLLRIDGELENELAMRFQQFTGPVMAKGIEDTLFYSFNRLISLNEVGGNPTQFGISVETFHRNCMETQERWPRTMLATSTHDTKRSEDVRARLNLLSEIPEPWSEVVHRWSALNEPYRTNGWPDRNTEYLLYQTLVGAWPIELERVLQYMEKAIREAKVYTSWTDQNRAYEEAVTAFIRAVLADERFTGDLEAFVGSIIELGWMNSLAQTLIKLTAPGVPDIYQGTELWDLSLVDPDNRRPVDYNLRRRLLAQLDSTAPEEVWTRSEEGLPKLWVIRQALALRQRRPELFGPESSYRPLKVSGPRAEHLIGYLRGEGAAIIVPRLVIKLSGDWDGMMVELPPGSWRDQFSDALFEGGKIRAGKLLSRFPVCLLEQEEINE